MHASSRPFARIRRRYDRLNDIDHFVLLMQENRSFDHYFGTMAGVRGYADPAARAVLERNRLQPFRLDLAGPDANAI